MSEHKDPVYGHVCCPNCGMTLLFTTQVKPDVEFENSKVRPERKISDKASPQQVVLSMAARIRKDVAGNWSRIYKPKRHVGLERINFWKLFWGA